MSGMAKAASTTPGRVATFWSCSSERSATIASISSASANTRAGTRMSARADAGISQSVSSIRCRSDIEHHRRPPAAVRRLHAEPVVGNGLHEVRRVGASAFYTRAYAALVDGLEVNSPRHDSVALGDEDELLDPGREEGGAVVRLDHDLTGDGIASVGPRLVALEQPRQRSRCVLEHRRLSRRLDVQLELARVVDPAIHRAFRWPVPEHEASRVL